MKLALEEAVTWVYANKHERERALVAVDSADQPPAPDFENVGVGSGGDVSDSSNYDIVEVLSEIRNALDGIREYFESLDRFKVQMK